MRKLIILFLVFTTLLSCGSFELATTTEPYSVNDFIEYRYNYNTIHHIYENNPSFFYGGIYLDNYGRERYMHMHPYYIRYVQEKRHRMVINRQRSNHNTTYRRTTSNNNNRTTVNNNNTTRRATTRRVTTVKPRTRTVRPTTRATKTTIRRDYPKRSTNSTSRRRN